MTALFLPPRFGILFSLGMRVTMRRELQAVRNSGKQLVTTRGSVFPGRIEGMIADERLGY
ncbi:MAG: hypothetical protein LBT22_04455 [Peptococcaceae bacterium]|jgi:hypothetical protein|nr:hypothetical protein [Peptococcaceae bacterium]